MPTRISDDVPEALAGASDWQTMRSDGATTWDVRLVFKTHDGDTIGMTYRGLRHGPPELLARIDRGESIDPALYYFRTIPLFETASEKYDWMNRILAVGIGYRRANGPLYSVFEVL